MNQHNGYSRPTLSNVDNQHFLFAMITVLANRLQSFGDTLFEEMTWKQWFAFLGTTVFQEPPSVTQVADTIGTSHQNCKQLLLRLERTGFVRLEKDPADMRRTLVHLTEQALLFDSKYKQQANDFMGKIYAGLNESEISTAKEVLVRMEKNLMQVISEEMEVEK